MTTPTSTRIHVEPPPIVHARLGAEIRIEANELTPAVYASLKHAASMTNPIFYERQRLRMSTWDTPRFLRSYDETIDGGLVLPRGMTDTATSLISQAGSRLELADHRAFGERQEFTFTATLTRPQHASETPKLRTPDELPRRRPTDRGHHRGRLR